MEWWVLRRCVYQREDEKGAVGVELNRDLVKVAGKALQKNLTRLGPLVLPVSEQLRFAHNYVLRKVLGKKGLQPYVPDFTKAFDHFCLHAGVPLLLPAPLFSPRHDACMVPLPWLPCSWP